MGLKKKVVLSWLAFEAVGAAIALPAAGQIVDKVMFTSSPRTIAVDMPQSAGKAGFIVASNAPFMIISEGAIGDMHISIRVNGKTENGQIFGTNAQNPGIPNSCVTALSPAPSSIYTAIRKTAASRGHILDQAVIVEIEYDKALTPKFRLETLDTQAAKTANTAPACQAQNT